MAPMRGVVGSASSELDSEPEPRAGVVAGASASWSHCGMRILRGDPSAWRMRLRAGLDGGVKCTDICGESGV